MMELEKSPQMQRDSVGTSRYMPGMVVFFLKWLAVEQGLPWLLYSRDYHGYCIAGITLVTL